MVVSTTTSSLFYKCLLMYAAIMIAMTLISNKIFNETTHHSSETDGCLLKASFMKENTTGELAGTPGSPNELEKQRSTNSPYAYAWLLGTIHEDKLAYKGFIYNILIAAKILREKGSTADFVLWAQLSSESNLKGRLPKEDERMLKELGVEIRMIETVEQESFAQIVYEKFRLLTMTEYKRVIFLDADIMPRTHLDYLFHLSVNDDGSAPLLRPNLILATRGEPCNTAMFMVEPRMDGWKLIQDTIKRQREEGSKLPYPHFSYTRGWGYTFKEHDDPWQAINRYGEMWRFHAAHSDQGLMYYYAKMGIKDTSIVIGQKLQNWVPGKNGLHKKDFEDDFQSAIANRFLTHLLPTPESRIRFNCPIKDDKGFCNGMPYEHMVHFSGSNKPWQPVNPKNRNEYHRQRVVWFDNLRQLNEKYNMSLDIDNWDTKHNDIMQESPLGYIARYFDHSELLKEAANRTAMENDEQTGDH